VDDPESVFASTPALTITSEVSTALDFTPSSTVSARLPRRSRDPNYKVQQSIRRNLNAFEAVDLTEVYKDKTGDDGKPLSQALAKARNCKRRRITREPRPPPATAHSQRVGAVVSL
jgi:hypothetical protein